LIGLLIGIVGVQGSLKGPSAISILFPILAMGLPISDTAMAIFRRWVRNLPMSAADRRHVHHLLIGLGLNPRQAAILLYCFSSFMCGAVLLGVALRSEFLALVMGLSGCLAFLVVVTSRRDELANLRGDFNERMLRGRQERQAALLTWEAIQRMELCGSPSAGFEIMERTAEALGCDRIRIECDEPAWSEARVLNESAGSNPAGREAVFRLACPKGPSITIGVDLGRDMTLAADIVFRYLNRLGQSLGERLEELAVDDEPMQAEAVDEAEIAPATAEGPRAAFSLKSMFTRGPRGAEPSRRRVSPPIAGPAGLARR
jgi:UDP-GlcNAc:undecaprenyl-phosphate GlcNAc-1-phosphate transferase